MRRRGSVNVRFAPKATEVLRRRELTRCATRVLTRRSKKHTKRVPDASISGGGVPGLFATLCSSNRARALPVLCAAQSDRFDEIGSKTFRPRTPRWRAMPL